MIKKLLIVVFILLVSCDKNRVFDSYTALENNEWQLEKPIAFRVSIKDTISPKNVFIQLRNNDAYLYRNLFLITKLSTPDNTQKIDTLEYEMSDVYGRWLGSGLTDVKENKLYYLENFTFPKEGEYTFEISHAMRQRGKVEGIEQLQGIVDVGLRIESIE